MVKVRDDGVFDAPIEKIWRYLGDDSPGVHNHQAILGSKTVENRGSEIVQEWEMRNPDGKTTRKETWRMVMNPPKGFEMESLAGASKGTKYSNRYSAMGAKTRVEVEGEFHFQGMDDASTRKAALGFLAQVFDEDNAALKKYK
jgi:hypothetical protein